ETVRRSPVVQVLAPERADGQVLARQNEGARLDDQRVSGGDDARAPVAVLAGGPESLVEGIRGEQLRTAREVVRRREPRRPTGTGCLPLNEAQDRVGGSCQAIGRQAVDQDTRRCLSIVLDHSREPRRPVGRGLAVVIREEENRTACRSCSLVPRRRRTARLVLPQ